MTLQAWRRGGRCLTRHQFNAHFTQNHTLSVLLWFHEGDYCTVPSMPGMHVHYKKTLSSTGSAFARLWGCSANLNVYCAYYIHQKVTWGSARTFDLARWCRLFPQDKISTFSRQRVIKNGDAFTLRPPPLLPMIPKLAVPGTTTVCWLGGLAHSFADWDSVELSSMMSSTTYCCGCGWRYPSKLKTNRTDMHTRANTHR